MKTFSLTASVALTIVDLLSQLSLEAQVESFVGEFGEDHRVTLVDPHTSEIVNKISKATPEILVQSLYLHLVREKEKKDKEREAA